MFKWLIKVFFRKKDRFGVSWYRGQIRKMAELGGRLVIM